MEWDVVSVEVIGPRALSVRFFDGTTGEVRFEESRFRGVFQPLKDHEFFRQAHATDGFVTWPGELDLAPDAMYDAIKAHGEWVLA